MKRLTKNMSTDDRFFHYSSHPDKNGCINWLGSKDKNGYGRIKPSGEKRIRAHRFSYQRFIGAIPDGYFVCHNCDNPSCVNPKHLWLGTNAENTKDRSIKDRSAKNNLAGLPLKLLPNSKLTKENVLEIRKLISNKIPQIQIAKKFNVHRDTILKIKKGITWYHLP